MKLLGLAAGPAVEIHPFSPLLRMRECEVRIFVFLGFLLGKANGLNHGSGASSPRSINDSLPMITRQDPG